jgi:hypothetical protein
MALPIVAAALSAFTSLAETVGTIFTSGDKVKIAQTEVDIAKEKVNAIKAQGDIEQIKLAEKALDVKIVQYNTISEQNKSEASLAQTRAIGWFVIGIVVIIVLYLGYKVYSANNPKVQQVQYIPDNQDVYYPIVEEYQEVKSINTIPQMEFKKISGE